MPEQKTKPTEVSVQSFLDKVPDEGVRDDCQELIKIMKKITGEPPKMWVPALLALESIITNMTAAMKGIRASQVFRRENKI